MAILGLDTRLKKMIFCLYIFMWPALHTLMAYSRSASQPRYEPTSVVLLTEMLKLLFALTCYFIFCGGPGDLMSTTIRSIPLLLAYTVPAGLYCVFNNLVFVNLTHFDPGTYNIVLQSRIVLTALLWQTCFSTPLNANKWTAIGFISLGCVCLHLPQLRQSGMHTVNSDARLLLLLQVLASVCATVSTEILLKRGCKRGRESSKAVVVPTHLHNVFMYVQSILWNAVILQWNSSLGEALSETNLKVITSPTVLIIIVTFAATGQLTSFFLRYLNSVVKSFATACEVLIAVGGAYLVLGTPISKSTMQATTLIICGVILYDRPPVSSRHLGAGSMLTLFCVAVAPTSVAAFASPGKLERQVSPAHPTVVISNHSRATRRVTILAESFKQVTKALDRMRFPYHVDFGTLLGFERDGTFIPSDNDIDIAVYGWSDRTEEFKAGLSRLEDHKFTICRLQINTTETCKRQCLAIPQAGDICRLRCPAGKTCCISRNGPVLSLCKMHATGLIRFDLEDWRFQPGGLCTYGKDYVTMPCQVVFPTVPRALTVGTALAARSFVYPQPHTPNIMLTWYYGNWSLRSKKHAYEMSASAKVQVRAIQEQHMVSLPQLLSMWLQWMDWCSGLIVFCPRKGQEQVFPLNFARGGSLNVLVGSVENIITRVKGMSGPYTDLLHVEQSNAGEPVQLVYQQESTIRLQLTLFDKMSLPAVMNSSEVFESSQPVSSPSGWIWKRASAAHDNCNILPVHHHMASGERNFQAHR